MSTLRVIKSCVVTPIVIDENGNPAKFVSPISLRADEPYDSDDPIVQQFPWAFAPDNAAATVEEASARPGERRNVTRS